MGAGGSIDYTGPKPAKQDAGGIIAPASPLSFKIVAKGEVLPDGIGRVVPLSKKEVSSTHSKPLTDVSNDKVTAWFVECVQCPGQWEPYNDESSQVLEEAFLHQEPTCMVVHNKRGYTVDVINLMQLSAVPGQEGRKVLRGTYEVVTDPMTGAPTKQYAPDTGTADPFTFTNEEEDENVDAVDSTSLGNNFMDELEQQHSPHGRSSDVEVEKGYPRLSQMVTPFLAPIFSMALHPVEHSEQEGIVAVVGGTRSRIVKLRLSDSEKCRVIERYRLPSSVSVLNVAYSPASETPYLAAGTDNNACYLFRDGNELPLQELCGHTRKVYGVSFQLDGRTLVTSSMDTTLRLWDVETARCLQSYSVQSSFVFSVKCSKTDPNIGVSVGNDFLLTVHDFRVPTTVVQRCQGHTNTLWNCDLHPSNLQYASCGKDCTVRLWDARNLSTALHVINNHVRAIHSVEYLPDGGKVISSGRDGLVVCTNATTGEGSWIAKAHSTPTFRVCYAQAEKKMITCAHSSVNLWEWNANS